MNNATSRGTFLVTEKNRIVFLTVDLIFGPLNIITEESICLDNVTGFIENRKFVLEKSGLIIDYSNCPVWKTPMIDAFGSQSRIRSKILQVVPFLSSSPFIPFLHQLLSLPVTGNNSFSQQANSILQKMISGEDCTKDILVLLGTGKGLTPSFDDLFAGVLFVCAQHDQALQMNQIRFDTDTIVQEAFSRTNLVSASLLEAAAAGEADSNLTTLIKAVADPGIADIKDSLIKPALSWGNSSGEDFFAGATMALTLLALK